MKKFLYGIIALAGLAMVGCSNEYDEQITANTEKVDRVFYGYTESDNAASTRTTLDENGKVVWSGEEHIAINGTEFEVYQPGTEFPSTNVMFSPVGDLAEAEAFNAVYPFEAWAAEGKIDFSHLKEQEAKNATFGHGYAVTVGQADEDGNIYFRNAMSFLRVNFTLAAEAKEDAITIKKIVLTADDNLWGEAEVDYTTGVIGEVVASTESAKTITYLAGEDVVLTKDNSYEAYIALPPHADNSRVFDLYVEGENAWTGTKYTWSREDLTGLKFQRNIITTVNRAITPREVEYVAEGVYKTDEKRFVVENEAGFIWTLNALNEAYSNANHMMRGATIVLNKEDGIFNFKGMTVPVVNATDITIDGNNMTLENVTYDNSTDANYVAMFNLFVGNIKNLYMDKVSASHLGASGRASALIGYYCGGELENIQINKANVAGFQKVGGLVSFIEGNAKIVNCSTNNVKLVANKDVLWQAGGLVGYIAKNANVLIEDSSVYGVTLTNTAQMSEGEDDESWFSYFSGGFVGSIASSNKVEFKDCKLSGVTARPALEVSRRGHELFGDRFTYGYENISGYDTKEPSVVIVDGVSLEERHNPQLDVLNAAIEAAEEGETVTLTENIKLFDDQIVLIPEGKNITLDLAGKTIVTVENTKYAINNLGTLTLKDSAVADDAWSIQARGIYNGYENVTSAKIIVESGNYLATGTDGGAAIFNYGEAEIKGGKFQSSGGYGLNNRTGAKMTVKDAIVNGGIYNTGATLTIDEGTTVYQHLNYKHAIYNYASEVIINGGDFDSVAGNELILVDGENAKVTIEGGKFVKTGKSWLFGAATNKNITFTINDGEFYGYVNMPEGTVDTFRPYGDPIVVHGGIYNFNPANWVVKGKFAVLNEDTNMYEIVEAGAKIGDEPYLTFADAIAAAGAEDVINLFEGEYQMPTNINSKTVNVKGKGRDLTTIKLENAIASYATALNFEDITMVRGNENYKGFQHIAEQETYKNCKIVGTLWTYAPVMKFEDTLFTNTKDDVYNVWVYSACEATFERCEFDNADGKAILVYGEGVREFDVTVKDTKFKAAKVNEGKTAIQMHTEQGNFGTLTVEDCTVEGFDMGINGGLWNDINNTAKTPTDKYLKKIDGIYYIGSSANLETVLKNVEEDVEKIDIKLYADASVNVSAHVPEYYLGGANTAEINIEGYEFIVKGNGDQNPVLNFSHTNTDWNYVRMNNENGKWNISNVGISNSGANNGPWNRHNITFYNEVNLTNVTSNRAIALESNAKLNKVAISDVHPNNSEAYALWIQPNGQTVDIDGLTITPSANKKTDRGITINEQYVDAPAKVTLNIANANFKTQKKAAIIVKSKAGAEINWGEGNNITNVAADPVNGVWVDEDMADYADLVVVNGTTCIVEGSRVIATVGGVEYDDVKEALDAAQSGDTVTLAAGTYTFPAADLKEGVILECEEGTIFSGSSNLNINGATIKGATFSNEEGRVASSTINGTFVGCTFDGYNALRYCYGGEDLIFEDCYFKSTTTDSGEGWVFHFDGVSGGLKTSNIICRRCTFDGRRVAIGGGFEMVEMEDCKFINGSYMNCYSDAKFTGNDFGSTRVTPLGGTQVYNNNIKNGAALTVDGVKFYSGYDCTVIIDGVTYANGSNSINDIIADAVTNGEEDVKINLPAGELNLDSQVGSGSSDQNKEVTIIGAGTNVTTVNGATNPHGNTNSPGNYAHGLDLVFENLTFVTENNGYQGGFGHAKSVTFKNCKIVGQFYCHSNAPHYFYDCTIDPLTGYLYTYASDVVFERCEFPVSNGKALQVYAESDRKNTVTITDCNFSTSVQATTWDGKPVTPIDINSANGATFVVNITNCTETGFPVGLNSGDSLWNNKCDMSLIDLTIDGFKMITGGIAQYNDSYLATNANGLLKAVKNYDNTTIYLLDTTYEFTSLDIKNKANLTLTNYQGTPVLKGLTYITGSKASFKSLRFSNPDGNKTTPDNAGDLVDRHVNDMHPVVGVYVASDVEFNGCMFDMGGNVTYGFSAYASTTSKFDGCYFFCDNKRPISTNGSKTVVTGCAFYSPYHYALRIFENGGSNSYQEVTFTNNKYFNSNDKGEYEGINISRKGGTPTILGTFTVGNNKVNGVLSTPETLKFRHHKNVTMSDECVYNCTDGSFTGFESEL